MKVNIYYTLRDWRKSSLFFYLSFKSMKSDLSTRDFLIYAKGIRVVWVPNLFLKQIVNMEKIVEYEGTKNHYIVLQENAIMKNPETDRKSTRLNSSHVT